MFNLQRLKNWAHSSIEFDKSELNTYQNFQDQISLIDGKIEEYITELGREDKRLLVEYNDEKIPIDLLKLLSETILKNKELSVQQRAHESAKLNRIYVEQLKQLKNKIVALAVTETENVYLAYINSYIAIINILLKQYAHLLAIQRSGIYKIDNSGNLNAGEKMKVLKDNIEVRTAEINTRLVTDSLKR